MFKRYTMLVGALLAALPALLPAQAMDYASVEIEISWQPQQVRPGESGRLLITVTPPFGFSLTVAPSAFGIRFEEADGLLFEDFQAPEPDRTDAAGDHYVAPTDFIVPFSVNPEAAGGQRQVRLILTMQLCNDESEVCLLPEDLARTTSVTVLASAPETEQPAEQRTTEEGPAGGESAEEEPTDTEQPAAGDEEQEITQSADTDRQENKETIQAEGGFEQAFSDALEGGNLWIALALAFLAGILTSLTPCVYPMIPITISYVSGKAEGKARNGFFISLVLVLGIAVTYSILGIAAAATGSAFGELSQHPAVLGFVSFVLVAMGLSMLGAFELALPAGLQQKLQARQSGYFGALFVGLTIGLVAAPCVAPILFVMLAWIGSTQNIALGFLLMFVYALGMGLLFVLVGTFSNLMLPRSGQWMVWIKKVFAFVLFVLAVVFARPLLNALYPTLTDLALGAVLVLFGAVVGAFKPLSGEEGWWPILGKSAGVLLVAAGLVFFSIGLLTPYVQALPALATEEQSAWIGSLDTGLQIADSESRPVIIDFWADWCGECIELDNKTFSDPRVRSELERFVAIRIDGSDVSDPAFQEAKKRYNVWGLPRVIMIDSGGRIAHEFSGFRDADAVLNLMTSVD